MLASYILDSSKEEINVWQVAQNISVNFKFTDSTYWGNFRSIKPVNRVCLTFSVHAQTAAWLQSRVHSADKEMDMRIYFTEVNRKSALSLSEQQKADGMINFSNTG